MLCHCWRFAIDFYSEPTAVLDYDIIQITAVLVLI